MSPPSPELKTMHRGAIWPTSNGCRVPGVAVIYSPSSSSASGNTGKLARICRADEPGNPSSSFVRVNMQSSSSLSSSGRQHARGRCLPFRFLVPMKAPRKSFRSTLFVRKAHKLTGFGENRTPSVVHDSSHYTFRAMLKRSCHLSPCPSRFELTE